MSNCLKAATAARTTRSLTYVSAEPFLGHFGIGGLPHGESLLSMFLRKEHITAVLNTGMDRVENLQVRYDLEIGKDRLGGALDDIRPLSAAS
jgi:hypothetical protein